MTEHETEIPADTAEQIREIAREEAQSVYDDEVVEDEDGKEWSVRSMMDRFEVSRRTALGAMGLLLAGVVADPAEAVMRSYVGTAEAQSANDFTVPGDMTVGGTLSTESADVTGETFIRAYKSADSTGIAAGTYTNIGDTEDVDSTGEYSSSQFTPATSGWYDVLAKARIDPGADGDTLTIRLRNVTDGSNVLFIQDSVGNAGKQSPVLSTVADLTAGKSYEVQVADNDNNYGVFSGSEKTFCVFRKSVVHP